MLRREEEYSLRSIRTQTKPKTPSQIKVNTAIRTLIGSILSKTMGQDRGQLSLSLERSSWRMSTWTKRTIHSSKGTRPRAERRRQTSHLSSTSILTQSLIQGWSTFHSNLSLLRRSRARTLENLKVLCSQGKRSISFLPL